MLQDLRFSLRNLRNNPGFTMVAILTLALGIGANTAIFSVVNAVLLKRLPYPEPDRLVYIDESTKDGGHMSISFQDFLDWSAQSRSFEYLVAVRVFSHSLTGAGQPEIVRSLNTSADFFEELGAKPVIGRFYGPDDDKPGARPIVVLSHKIWQKSFQGDPGVVGRSMTLDEVPHTIIGVAPAGFGMVGRERDLFMPIGLHGSEPSWVDRGNHQGIRALGRLKPGVGIAQATADLKTIATRLQQQYPVTNAGVGVLLESYTDNVVQDAKPTLTMLLAAVGFVLLTACANVANLLLARGSSRQREMSIRAALGASRGRVIRQLLVESVVLATLGGALGCIFAAWGVDTLLKFAPKDVPRLTQAHLDFPVLGFTLAISVITGIVFGLLPAWRLSSPDLVQELKTGGRGQTSGRASKKLRSTLLVAEVALALLMVTGGGLMLRSILALQQVNPGFQTENVLTFGISLPVARYKKDDQQLAFFQRALEKVRAVPGVESAAIDSCTPLDGGCWGSIYTIGGRPVPPNDQLAHADFNDASADYFRTLKVPVLEGRVFTEGDTKDAPKVVVINQTMARHMFPGESALGKTIRQGFPQQPNIPVREIIGVVGDVQRYQLDHKPFDEVYFASPQNINSGWDFVVRTRGDPMSYTRAIEDALHELDKDLPLANFRTMTQMLGDSLAERKFSTILLGIFAALALGLAAVGIYGVTAYSVTLRTQEVGIRMALGAREADVLKLVLGQGLAMALAGVGAGLIASAGLTWLIASMLYGVKPRDPLTLAASAAMLVGVALIACYLPARRASRLDPMEALRVE